MVTMITALTSDIENILNLIKQMNDEDLEYLRYREEADPLIPRIIKSVHENHVLLFTNETEIFGFLEYELLKNNTILWVCSLYLKPEYRNKGYARSLVQAYKNMPREGKLPIAYRTRESNAPMMAFTRFIKGRVVRREDDGHIVVNVDMEELV